MPALARRVDRARRAGAATIAAGNVDVRREIADVRDVVRAYRLLTELVAGAPIAAPIIANVSAGSSRTIRWHIECLSRLAGIAVEITPDQALIRREDPPEIVGDNSLVRELTGWQPRIPIERTLADLLAEARAEDAPGFAS